MLILASQINRLCIHVNGLWTAFIELGQGFPNFLSAETNFPKILTYNLACLPFSDVGWWSHVDDAGNKQIKYVIFLLSV